MINLRSSVRRALALMPKLFVALSLSSALLCSSPATVMAEYSSIVGAVNFWTSTSELNVTSTSAVMNPNHSQDGLSYYSLTSFFQDRDFGMYAGIQTNNGTSGKFIFSIWNATVAYPADSSIESTPFGGEGVGHSLRFNYDWDINIPYLVKIYRTQRDPTTNTYRWAASITNQDTNATKVLGEIVAPSAASDFIVPVSLFHERFAGTESQCTATSSALEKTGVTFSEFKANNKPGTIVRAAPNNIFANPACEPYISYKIVEGVAYSALGMTQTELDKFINTSLPPPSLKIKKYVSGLSSKGYKDANVDPVKVTAGDTVTYKIELVNTGTVAASKVVLGDQVEATIGKAVDIGTVKITNFDAPGATIEVRDGKKWVVSGEFTVDPGKSKYIEFTAKTRADFSGAFDNIACYAIAGVAGVVCDNAKVDTLSKTTTPPKNTATTTPPKNPKTPTAPKTGALIGASIATAALLGMLILGAREYINKRALKVKSEK